MSGPPKDPPLRAGVFERVTHLTLGEPVVEQDAQERVDDYLDHHMAPLVGLIPYQERMRIRRELHDFLENDINLYILQGLDPQEAVEAVLGEYGDSRVASDDILHDWFYGKAGGRITQRIGFPEVCALVIFGIADCIVGGLVQLHIIAVNSLSNPLPLTFGLSPAQLRSFIPAPMPLPQRSETFGLFIAALIALPIVAGILTGWVAPIRTVRAVYHTMAFLILCSFVSGVLMLPACYGLVTAMCQIVYWLPAGCLCSWIGSLARRYYACRYPLPAKRRPAAHRSGIIRLRY